MRKLPNTVHITLATTTLCPEETGRSWEKIRIEIHITKVIHLSLPIQV